MEKSKILIFFHLIRQPHHSLRSLGLTPSPQGEGFEFAFLKNQSKKEPSAESSLKWVWGNAFTIPLFLNKIQAIKAKLFRYALPTLTHIAFGVLIENRTKSSDKIIFNSGESVIVGR